MRTLALLLLAGALLLSAGSAATAAAAPNGPPAENGARVAGVPAADQRGEYPARGDDRPPGAGNAPTGGIQQIVVSFGTAWPIETGHVVTNNHVIAGSREIRLVDQEGNEMIAWPVVRDERHDIALLEVADGSRLPPALPLAREEAYQGARVFTVGFPRPASSRGAVPRPAVGVIVDNRGINADPDTYQTSVPIEPGNSGGPLINMRGEVVGVVTAMLAFQDPVRGTVEPLPNASSARKIGCVTELLLHLPAFGRRLPALPARADSLEKLTDKIRRSVLIVISSAERP